MAITSSGQIALIADIEAEFDQTGTTDISLIQARSDAGLGDGQIAMTSFYGLSDSVAPSVTTNSASSITSSSMTANGNITSDGGATITERGFYFGTSTNAVSNTKFTVSGTTGSFSRSMTSLSGGTTYRIFAFGTNSVGTTIGSMVTQATSQPTVDSAIQRSGFPNTATQLSETDIFTSGGFYKNNTGTTITFDMTGSVINCSTTPHNGYVAGGGTFTLNNGVTWNAGGSFQRSGNGPGYVVASASGYISTTYRIF
jgi:hypothetical protein